MLLSAMFTSFFDICVANHVNRKEKKNFDWMKDNYKPITDVFRKVANFPNLLIVSTGQSEYFGS